MCYILYIYIELDTFIYFCIYTYDRGRGLEKGMPAAQCLSRVCFCGMLRGYLQGVWFAGKLRHDLNGMQSQNNSNRCVVGMQSF